MADDVVVIGVGNPMRGDDGVGLRVVSELEGRVEGYVRLVSSNGDPGTLLEAWDDADTAVVVDAMVSGEDPGTVAVFDVSESPLPAETRLRSSHEMGAALAVELGRALDRLPRRLVIIGVEVDHLDEGTELSAPVEAAVAEVVASIKEVVADA